VTEGAALGFVAVAIVGYARAHGGLAVASMGLHAAPLAVTPVDDQETPPAAGADIVGAAATRSNSCETVGLSELDVEQALAVISMRPFVASPPLTGMGAEYVREPPVQTPPLQVGGVPFSA